MMRPKVLVTGGAGYIGSHTVVELINADYEVVIVDNLSKSEIVMLDGIETIVEKKNPFYQVDCLDKKALDKVFSDHAISAVIHFAAHKSVSESVQKPMEYYRNNVESLITLLEIMQNH